MDARKVKLLAVERLIWFIAVAGYLVFMFLLPRIFLDPANFDFIVRSGVSVGIIALAEAICLISGSIDVSITAIAGFAGVLIVTLRMAFFPGMEPSLEFQLLMIVLAFIVGAVLGALNGLLVKKVRIHPFLITLSTYIVFMGARKLLYEGSERVYSGIINIIGGGQIVRGVSYSLIIVLITMAILWVFLNYTVTGMRIYAIGGNPRSSALMGINVGNLRFLVHTLAGVLAGLSGLLFIGYNRATTPEMLDLNVFDAFAMAILGGIALEGGRGRIEDVFAGIFFISTLTIAMSVMGINVYLRQTVVGIFILAGVMINSLREKIRDRILAQI